MNQFAYREALVTVPTMTDAIVRSFSLAGLEPKEAAWRLDIRYDTFSRMINPTDSRHFPPDLIVKAMLKFGNKFPLHWLAYQMGEATYPLEFMSVLKGIRDALEADGKSTNFSLLYL